MKGQVKAAIKGNTQAAKLLLQKFEGFSEKTTIQPELAEREFTQQELAVFVGAMRNVGVDVILPKNGERKDKN